MEFHERMAIAHSLHTFCNPISEQSVVDLIRALDLRPGMAALDIACGAGELLVRLAAEQGARGVGVDVSPRLLERAREAAARRAPDADLRFIEMDGAKYRPDAGETFDIVSLIGASWIWKGYRGTLAALRNLVRPGGQVWFGEPYWKVDPPPASYCEAEDLQPETFTSLAGLDVALREEGFDLIYLVVSSGQDWDRYETLQALATDCWARSHPDHSDREEVQQLCRASVGRYLRWGREVLGFAQLLLRAPGD